MLHGVSKYIIFENRTSYQIIWENLVKEVADDEMCFGCRTNLYKKIHTLVVVIPTLHNRLFPSDLVHCFTASQIPRNCAMTCLSSMYPQ